jgi:hypothetical protein
MSHPSPIRSDLFSHDLLVHDGDDDLLAGTRTFVEQGLSSGGQVIVHSTRERVAMLREALDPHPRLEFGLDEDLYQSPTSTLFAYQRAMAESPEPIELWATGTVPLGEDPATHPAWARYESVVNAVLGPYAFHGLCTYDARVLPPDTIAAARATHPSVSTRGHRTDSPEYQDPAEFLANPLAGVPGPPDAPPLLTASLESAQDLRGVRLLVRRGAESSTAVPRGTIDAFVSAVHEVLANGLQHGAPPVRLTLWVETAKLTCLVTDTGQGSADLLSGYDYPEAVGPMGLWVARQLCEELFISNQQGSGCRVLLSTA